MTDSLCSTAKKKPKNLYDIIGQRYGEKSTDAVEADETGTQSSQSIFVLVEDSSDESEESEEENSPPSISFVPPWRFSAESAKKTPQEKVSTPKRVLTDCGNVPNSSSQDGSRHADGKDTHKKLLGTSTSDTLYTVVEQDSCCVSQSIHSRLNRTSAEASSPDQSVLGAGNKENINPRLCEKRSLADSFAAHTPQMYAHNNTSTKPHHDGNKVVTRNVAVQTVSPETKKSLTRRAVVADGVKQEAPSQVTVNHTTYTVLNLLGKGGSSKVERVFDVERCRLLALKTVNLVGQPAQNVAAFRKEIEMLKKLQFSPRVINMIDFEESTDRLYLLLECGDTDLAVYLKRKLEDKSLHRMQRCMFWHDMLQAVQVLHEQGIVHSDIKPANFMLVAGEIKLIDFGIARQLDADATSMELECCVGTLNYMSPEVLQGLGSKLVHSKAGRKADVWSLGCILYYMTYGHTPFQSISTLVAKVSAITSDLHTIDMEDVGEPHLVHTLQLCLLRDYKKRASIEELLDHPYVK